MFAPGHVAMAVLVTADRSLWGWAALGSLVPDLIDKSWVLLAGGGSSRTIGHSVLTWGALAIVAGLARSPRARAVVVGGLSHLWLDLVDGVLRGLFESGQVVSSWMVWPVLRPDSWTVTLAQPVLDAPAAPILSELLVVVVVIAGALGARRS